MKHLLPLLVFTFLFAGALAGGETFEDCVMYCQGGDNPCTRCCAMQHADALQPCHRGCADQQFDCFATAREQCRRSGEPVPACMRRVAAPCERALQACQNVCIMNVQIAGGCPGEMRPQPCPYNCQVWNPAIRSCVGTAANLCPPPPPQTCPYTCQQWNDLLQRCMGAARNDCAKSVAAAAPETSAKARENVPPTCDYDCQSYDAKSGTCVGPPRNGCEVALALAKETAAEAAEATKKMKTKSRRKK